MKTWTNKIKWFIKKSAGTFIAVTLDATFIDMIIILSQQME